MKIYLVGGAVRDILMGVKPKDRDYVVVGATEQDMLDAGYKKVHAPFPVFLHPKTKEEYALARREKKTGTGYLGFTSEYSPDVTLEEDLSRRDLTINSMAVEENNPEAILIDPFGGRQDLKNKCLRHTSNAFAEDPVRVLRVARFMARFGKDWHIAYETSNLMMKMGDIGVLKELTKERVWKEFSRALMESTPELFFAVLNTNHILDKVFPALKKIEPETWGALKRIEHSMDLETRFAIFACNFKDPKDVEKFCSVMSVPTKIRNTAIKVTRYRFDRLRKMTSSEVVQAFVELNLINDPSLFQVMWKVAYSYNDMDGFVMMMIHRLSAVREVTFDNVFPDGETDHIKIREGMMAARVAAYDDV